MRKINFFPEQKLINRIKSNDRTVLSELFVRYEKLVSGYVSSRGGDTADAEDMLQEAIIVLWQKVCSGKFELTSKLSTFILAIVKNKWSAEMRKRSRFSNQLPVEASDGNPSSLEGIIKEEKITAVKKALNALKSPCKELLTLFYFEERNFHDIARILGFANAEVAKSKKYQCKKSLEMILKKHTAQAERRL